MLFRRAKPKLVPFPGALAQAAMPPEALMAAVASPVADVPASDQPGPRPAPQEARRERAAPDQVAGPAELETGGVFTVNLAAIVKNWKALAQRVVPADCAAVVKADGYGCGADQVATELFNAGCRTFFVASLAEARLARAATPQAVIYVLNGFAPGSASAFAAADVRPVIGSLAEFVEWDAFRRASGWNGAAALHFETGMNRLGMPVEAVDAFTARLKIADHGVALVMSHLACADTPDHPLNAKQIAAFRDLRFMFRGTATSLANSSGIFLGTAAHCDMVRPGAALYGINPTPATQNLMEPVVTLRARIVQVREVERGATVGYGAAWTAKRSTRIAIVAAGYGDGYPRAAGAVKSRAQAIISGRRCPVVGRVSMDLTAFDASELPEHQVRRGDFATLIGDGITLDDLAGWSNTIGYEVLTAVGRRYRRVWKR